MDTPLERGLSLSVDQCLKTTKEKKRMSNVPYASAIGILMHTMLCTWLDICFVVGSVSHYQRSPGLTHWQAIKTIFYYLHGTNELVLCYQK